jgi:hypothetical protein
MKVTDLAMSPQHFIFARLADAMIERARHRQIVDEPASL